MKHLKYYELENEYHAEKDTLDYPSVSYTQDSGKVWYKKIINQVKMSFRINEDDVNNNNGEDILVWKGASMFDSVTVNGVEQIARPIQSKELIVEPQIGEDFALTDSSYISSYLRDLKVVFDEPLPQDANFVVVMHDKQKNNDTWEKSYWCYTIEDFIYFYDPQLDITEDGRLASLTINIEDEYDINTQKSISVHTFTSEEDPYDFTLSQDNLINTKILYIDGGLMPLGLPTTEVKDYEVIATIYRNVDSMYGMFGSSSKLISIDLSSFNTSNVTDMSDMFASCSSLTSLDLSNFNTSNVTDMGGMFSSCIGLTSIDLSSFDTRNVTNMGSMFSSCGSLTSLDLSSFDTSNVTDMGDMFSSCGSLTSLDLSNFDASKVTDVNRIFDKCSGLTSLKYFKKTPSTAIGIPTAITSVDFSSWDASNVTSMIHMFYTCKRLTSIDLSTINASKVTNMYNTFTECWKLTSIDLSGLKMSNVTNMYNTFLNCSGLTSITIPQDLSLACAQGRMEDTFGIKDNVTIYHDGKCDMAWEVLVSRFRPLQTATFVPALNPNIENVEYDWITATYDVTSTTESCKIYASPTLVYKMEVDGEELEVPASAYTFSATGEHEVRLAVQRLNGYSTIRQMFRSCPRLTSVDFSEFDTNNVLDMSRMFQDCSALTAITFGDNFDTSKVTYMGYMFYNCTNLTSIDLSSFDTSNVTDMDHMFYGCKSLTSLDLSSFDTSNLTNMSYMFDGSISNIPSLTSLTFGSQADVSKVTGYNYMFSILANKNAKLYYPLAYADAWNNILVTNQSKSKFPSTWTATAIDYENGETAPMSE